MSQNFIINVKVIVSVVAAIGLTVISVIFKSWVDSEKEFKVNMVKEIQEINKTLGQMNVENVKHEGYHTTNDLWRADADRRIKGLRKSFTNAGLILIDYD